MRTAKATLLHEGASLTVDLSLIVENDSFALPGRCKLMCIGTLEQIDMFSESYEASQQQAQSVPVRGICDRARQVAPKTRFVLLAIWAKTMNELDIRLWVQAAREMHRSLQIDAARPA